MVAKCSRVRARSRAVLRAIGAQTNTMKILHLMVEFHGAKSPAIWTLAQAVVIGADLFWNAK
jgi:uncharacterized membrane protein